MADIFGKTPDDYTYQVKLREKGKFDAWQHRWAQYNPASTPHHDFNALGAGVPTEYQRATQDAQALGFITNNLLAIQAQVDEILYTKFRLPMFVELNMSIPEGADFYGVKVRDRVGRARRVTGPGWDAPSATVSRALVQHPMFYYGLDAEWSVDELRAAMFSGTPLDTESIEAAIEGSLEEMEYVGLNGDDQYQGLVNLPTTGDSAVNRSNSTFEFAASGTTAIQIRSAINSQISMLIENSKETLGSKLTTGLNVYLPGAQYDLLTDKYIGDDQRRTVMDSLKADNPWSHFTENETGTRQPLGLKRVMELAGAGASNTDRMITMLKHMRIAEMGVSIMPRVLAVVNKGRVICAQVESKYSPLFVKRPNTIYYFDGI